MSKYCTSTKRAPCLYALAASARTMASLPSSAPIATTWSRCTLAPKPMVRSAKRSRVAWSKATSVVVVMAPHGTGRGSGVVDEVEFALEARDREDPRDRASLGGAHDEELLLSAPGTRVRRDEDAQTARVHERELAQIDDDIVARIEVLADHAFEL